MEMSLIAPKFRASIFSSHLHVYIMYIYIYMCVHIIQGGWSWDNIFGRFAGPDGLAACPVGHIPAPSLCQATAKRFQRVLWLCHLQGLQGHRGFWRQTSQGLQSIPTWTICMVIWVCLKIRYTHQLNIVHNPIATNVWRVDISWYITKTSVST